MKLDALVPRGLPPALEKGYRKLIEASRRKPQPAAEELLPPHPEALETHVTIPPPPRVPEYLDREEQLAFVARWYRAAVESRGLVCPPLAPKGSHRRYFEDFLEVCLEKEIRPGAWVAWALDRVLARLPTNARRRFRPPVKVLLSPKTLGEHRWMFREAEADYVVSQLKPSDAGEAFLKRWRALRLEVLAGPRTPEAARAALARAFPEGYREARRQCGENTRAEGQAVAERIRLGDWLWAAPRKAKGRGEEGNRR